MTIRGNARNYHKRFAFLVEIEEVGFAGFQTCSELAAEVAVIEQNEGGALTPDKSPGRAKVDDLTLERGATQDQDLYQWWLDVVNISANSGLPTPQLKREVEIVQLERDRSILRRWQVNGAWPRRFVAGSWDNDADENVIETMVLAIDSFDPIASAGGAS